MGFEVVVRGQDAGTEQFLLQDLDEVQQVFGLATADVVHGVRGHGKAILSGGTGRSALHYTHHAFHNIIHVGEIPPAVAEVENLDGLAAEELVGEAEIRHIGPTGGAIHRKEAKPRGRNVVQLGIGVSFLQHRQLYGFKRLLFFTAPKQSRQIT